MAEPIWYTDLTEPQKKRADKWLSELAKINAKAEHPKRELQKLRRIAATNRTRKAAKRVEGE